MRTVYTLGHSKRSIDELIEIVRASGIARVVDIRTIPRSRANPQFNGDVLEGALRAAGLAYTWLAALGGRRSKRRGADARMNAGWTHAAFHNYADYADTPAFRDGLRELLALASREACVILCAEAVWWRCHRRIVSDHLLARGVPVVHLLGPHRSQPATLTPFAAVAADGRVTYPHPS